MQTDQHRDTRGDAAGPDYRMLRTWIVTALIVYALLSGLVVRLLPFSVFVQYSVLVHSAVGLLCTVPMVMAVVAHRRRRSQDAPPAAARIAVAALLALLACLGSGLVVAAMALFGVRVHGFADGMHLVTALALAALLVWHLVPMLRRYRTAPPTPRRPARRRYAAAGAAIVAALFVVAAGPAALQSGPDPYRAFADDYEWPHGDDRPFWPSRAALADTPWFTGLMSGISATLGAEQAQVFRATLDGPQDEGLRAQVKAVATQLGLSGDAAERIDQLVEQAVREQRAAGALRPEALAGSAGCGSSGCHEAIYEEWRASAHGFAAEDVLFRRVQDLLIAEQGAAASRSCAGCHDPAALLGGTRQGTDTGELAVFEGNSCITCHSTVATDTNGNGGYVIRAPRRYLFEDYASGAARLASKFLIRSVPGPHVAEYSRPLYGRSEFCAACHKQVPAPGDATSAGLAQEQNEYDSWKQGRWYHGEDDPATIDCRECHMPLVDGGDPASGDDRDAYRSPGDGKHRSHRVLASNMYIPAAMDLPGGEEQAAQTIAWLRGEIEVPEIADKWTTGPTVSLEIDAPERIRPGDLVNIKLHLHNNKTGHDFPAGPLDVLESWIELTVTDDRGNTLMELGADRSISPSIDAPVVYKADWYDRQGLPVERHNLWDVVGASYRRVIRSGGNDVIDVPFRCPGIARPRLSVSASEDGPGGRQSDVVFAINNADIGELRVTARLLFRKANPEFLARVYDFEPVTQAPVIEIARAAHAIRVVDD